MNDGTQSATCRVLNKVETNALDASRMICWDICSFQPLPGRKALTDCMYLLMLVAKHSTSHVQEQISLSAPQLAEWNSAGLGSVSA